MASENAQKDRLDIVRNLFAANNEVCQLSLQKIIAQPSTFYIKALLRLKDEEMPAATISIFVQALAVCAKTDALTHIVPYLRHHDGQVRACCITAIGLSGVNYTKNPNVINLLVNFLVDSEPQVVRNCIRVLAERVDKNKISAIVNDYWDGADETKCLNALHLIQELSLTQNKHILQTALNHKSIRIRAAAEKLKPLFAAQQDVEQYQLRSYKSQPPNILAQYQKATKTPPAELKQKLKELQKTDQQAEKIELLLQLQKHTEGATLLPQIREMLTTEQNTFVLATLVKTISLLSGEDEWDNLKPFLHHADGRIRSNTLEVFAERLDQRVIPFAKEIIDNFSATDSHHIRIISACIPVLRSREPELGLKAMKTLAAGDIGSVAAFITLLPKWKDSRQEELTEIVLELLHREIRKEVLEACIEFLSPQISLELYEKIKPIILGLKDGTKKQLLIAFAQKIKSNCHLELADKEEFTNISTTAEFTSDFSDRVAHRLKQDLAPKSGLRRYWFFVKALVVKPKFIYSYFGLLFVLIISSSWFLWHELPKAVKREVVAISQIRFADQEVQEMQKKRQRFVAQGTVERIDRKEGILYVNSNLGQIELQLQKPTGIEKFRNGDNVQLIGVFANEYEGTMVLQASAIFHKLQYLTRTEKNKR